MKIRPGLLALSSAPNPISKTCHLAACLASTSFMLAHAQAKAADILDEIVVTGSAFNAADSVSSSPVTVYGSDYISDSGSTSLGQLLHELPFVAGKGSTPADNGGIGAYHISLRGLGAARTLVLVNGKRVVATDASQLTDLNTIPVALVERIEILKDGASILYGSDAVAGVVNIILRDNVEHTKFSLRLGQSSESDADSVGLSLSGGKTWNDSSLVFSLSYDDEDEIYARDRDWAAQPYRVSNGQVIPSGSSAPPWGNYDGQTLGPDYGGDGEGGLRPYDGTTDFYNFSSVTRLHQPMQRTSLHLSGYTPFSPLSNKQLFSETELYLSIDHTSRDSASASASTPLAPLVFYGFPAPYSADNAYNPTGVEISDWRRRMVEQTSGRAKVHEVETTQLNIALQGDLNGGSQWEASVNHGWTDQDEVTFGLYDLNKVASAVGPTAVDGNNTLRCDTNGDGVFNAADDQACVPLNVFGENSVTQEMIDYLSFQATDKLETEQTGVQFTIAQPSLFEVQDGEVGVAGGLSSYRYSGKLSPDAFAVTLTEQGAVTGASSLPPSVRIVVTSIGFQ